MSRLYTAEQYARHLFRSRRWDHFHSPYLFALFTFCCREQSQEGSFAQIEGYRQKLLRDRERIHRTDPGAGSVYPGKNATARIRDIARQALSRPFQARFMARLVQMTRAGHVLELGTSLGITAAYLQMASDACRLTTVEGDPAIGRRAQKTFDDLGLPHIRLVMASFDDYIRQEAGNNTPIDILFIDGHHRSEAVLRYYHGLKDRLTAEAIVIIDDLYWSPDMQDGWRQLIGLPEITQSVDCFHFGLLFFKKEFLQKENHIIRLPMR